MFHILVTLNEVIYETWHFRALVELGSKEQGPVISSLLRRPEDRRDEGPSEFFASHLRHPDP